MFHNIVRMFTISTAFQMCMRKRDVSSPEGDSAQLYSYGPISVYSEARPSCLKVIHLSNYEMSFLLNA